MRHRRGVAQLVICRNRNVEVVGSSTTKGPRYFLEQETHPIDSLVLVGSRNGYERDFAIKLK